MLNLNSQKSNTLYLGLAGTGKSSRLAEDAITALSEGKNILYLIYNKKQRNETIRKYPLLKDHVHTFHSFAYNDLELSGRVSNMLEGYVPNYYDSYSEVPYQILECLPSWWLDNYEISSFRDLDNIYVEDLQQLKETMIDMLKILFCINEGVKIIATCDHYQILNNVPLEGIDDGNFKIFEELFGPTSVIELRTNHKNSPSIQNFLNAYYQKHFIDQKFFDLSKYVDKDFTDDVYVYGKLKEKELINKIEEIIKSNPEKKIGIIGGYDLQKIFNSGNDKIHCSGITPYVDDEFDIVILDYTYFNENYHNGGIKYLFNIAITRAKEKVHIISACPKELIPSDFKEDTYPFINAQRLLNYTQIKIIPYRKINFNIDKDTSIGIDSLELKINFVNSCSISLKDDHLRKLFLKLSGLLDHRQKVKINEVVNN